MKGSGLSSRDSSKLRVEVLYEALLVQHKYGTHKIYLVNKYVQCKAIQNIREIEFRDSGSYANTSICFEVRATALRPRLHTEGFPLCSYMTFHKETSTEELQLNTGRTQLSLTQTSTQEVDN